jgi:transcriptional regulator of acetoin/glycerol metabolism
VVTGPPPFDDESTRTVLRGRVEHVRFSLVVSTAHGLVTHDLQDGSLVTIGRAPDADISVPHPSLSRRHAKLRVDGTLTIEDLGSHNGTRLRDERMKPGREVALRPGDLLELGCVTAFVVGRGEEATATRAPVAAGGPVVGRFLDEAWPMVERVARGDIAVLLVGETGAGKEVLAELIHRASKRAKGPLVRINCAAVPGHLLESELFGHEKGAFTGADRSRPGLVEAAERGTLFLDEVGEMPLSMQPKLLRVIEEGEHRRVGSTRTRRSDVRIVAATNRDLPDDVERGRFRRDLFYRLNAFTLRIPPLRERLDEIEPLARAFLKNGPALTREALAVLHGYGWPGNVRELRNALERAALLAGRGPVRPEHLPPPIGRGEAAGDEALGLKDAVREAERERIMAALAATGGNQTRAAELLGVSRRTLVARLAEYDIPRPRKSR